MTTSNGSSDNAKSRPQPSSGYLDRIQTPAPSFFPRLDRLGDLSAAVTGLLSVTARLREKFETEHKDCVPRGQCNERVKEARDQAKAEVRFLRSMVKMLAGAVCGCIVTLGLLALQLIKSQP